MTTPVADFIRSYASLKTARFHMPGHKGREFLGCESFDITEIFGADALYEAEGIISMSEKNASALFGSGGTFYSTEGSSQCIRAMLYLALTNRPQSMPPVILAARNVHKAFIYAAALLDFKIVWIWPEEHHSLCACPITAEKLDYCLSSLDVPPAAVYLTSPDYLGGMADISSLAQVCRRYGTLLLVDNAHGAYLRFLTPSRHPLDCGADICCDSAHKTLPVLTGGAYLHLAKTLPESFQRRAKAALALFGSTSPSYLTLASLDICNAYLSQDYSFRLSETVKKLNRLRETLSAGGWKTEASDPLRLTLRSPAGLTGQHLAERLRRNGIECEYADRDYLVLMAAPENREEDFYKTAKIFDKNYAPAAPDIILPQARGTQVLSVRQALFSPCQSVPTEKSLGKICGTPTVSCPPAIPIVVPGERIEQEAVELFQYYGIKTVDILED